MTGVKTGIPQMPKKKRHSAGEIASLLKEADSLAAAGRTQSQIAQALGISVMTFHRWRKAAPPSVVSSVNDPISPPPAAAQNVAGRFASDRISELQLENSRLRRLVTDLLLEKMKLEEETQSSRGVGPIRAKSG
jgi:putative transposase